MCVLLLFIYLDFEEIDIFQNNPFNYRENKFLKYFVESTCKWLGEAKLQEIISSLFLTDTIDFNFQKLEKYRWVLF